MQSIFQLSQLYPIRIIEVPKYIFDERVSMRKLSFDYQNKRNPGKYSDYNVNKNDIDITDQVSPFNPISVTKSIANRLV